MQTSGFPDANPVYTIFLESPLPPGFAVSGLNVSTTIRIMALPITKSFPVNQSL